MESVRGHPTPLNASKTSVSATHSPNHLSKKLGPDALRQAALVLLDSNPDLKAMLDTAVAEKDEALRERNAAFRMHEEISVKYKESMRTCENIRLALTRAADEAAREKKESGEQIAFLLDTIKQLTSSKEVLKKEKAALETFFQEKLNTAESERAISLKTLDAVREESALKLEARTVETARAKEELAAALQKVESTQQMYEKLYDTEVRYVRDVLIPETNNRREAAENAAKQAISAAAQSDMEMQSSKIREQSTQEAFQGLQKLLLVAQENLEEQKRKVDQAHDKCAAEEQRARDAMSQAIAAEESFQMASKLLHSKCELEIESLMKKCESDIQKTKIDCEMIVSAAKAQHDSDIRLIRQLSDVEVAKYKAVAENASKSALDYASLHGYESWMHALQSAQEEARQSRENEIEAKKQTGYVIEELKRMTLCKERAELETKQVVARYGGLSMTQLIFPSEMENMDAEENPIKEHQKQNAAGDSSSFFSSFRRKLKEKFNSFTETKKDFNDGSDQDEPVAKNRLPSTRKQPNVPMSATRNVPTSNIRVEGSPASGKSLQSPTYSPPILDSKSPKNSPPKISTQSPSTSPQLSMPSRRNTMLDEHKYSHSSAHRKKSTQSTSVAGHEETDKMTFANGFQKQQHVETAHKQELSDDKITATRSQMKDARSKKEDTSELSSHSTNKWESRTSRPSSADSGSIQSSSSRDVHEGRLPAQYQNFRARQSNLTTIPKLSFSTPRQSDPGMRYLMRRDMSITDPLQCAWLQKASGLIAERIHVDFDVRVELVKLTEGQKMSGIQVALKGQSASVQSAADFILGVIDNLRQVSLTLHQFDSTNPSITVSEHEDTILKDLKMQLKRLDQLPSFWPIDLDAKIIDMEMPNIPSPKSPKNAHYRSLQNPIVVTAIVSEIDRHFIDAISGNMKHTAELLGLRV